MGDGAFAGEEPIHHAPGHAVERDLPAQLPVPNEDDVVEVESKRRMGI